MYNKQLSVDIKLKYYKIRTSFNPERPKAKTYKTLLLIIYSPLFKSYLNHSQIIVSREDITRTAKQEHWAKCLWPPEHQGRIQFWMAYQGKGLQQTFILKIRLLWCFLSKCIETTDSPPPPKIFSE